MKTTSFEKHLSKNGCKFLKNGKRHAIWVNEANGKRTTVPRHPTTDDDLCVLICKQLGIPKPISF